MYNGATWSAFSLCPKGMCYINFDSSLFLLIRHHQAAAITKKEEVGVVVSNGPKKEEIPKCPGLTPTMDRHLTYLKEEFCKAISPPPGNGVIYVVLYVTYSTNLSFLFS